MLRIVIGGKSDRDIDGIICHGGLVMRPEVNKDKNRIFSKNWWRCPWIFLEAKLLYEYVVSVPQSINEILPCIKK